jgi:YD repeat-containing protein
VSPDGIISTIAGNGQAGSEGDGGPATQARLNHIVGLAVGRDGSLFFTDEHGTASGFVFTGVRRVGTDGIVRRFAGTNAPGYSGEGGPATQATLNGPNALGVGPSGDLYIGSSYATFHPNGGAHLVRRVSSEGIITTIAGRELNGGETTDNVPARRLYARTNGLAVATDGAVYIANDSGSGVWRVAHPLPSINDTNSVVASKDGSELYVFDGDGRHLRTTHALTNAVLYTFGYDAAGRLSTLTDGDGNVTTIQRDGNGTWMATATWPASPTPPATRRR